jgi:hypothetical protein
MSGGGAVSLGNSITLTNAGVTSISGTTNQVSVSANTGGVTLSLPQSIATTSTPTFATLTATSGNQTTTLNYNTAVGVSAFKSDIATSATYCLTVGKAATTNNTANFRYNHAGGDGSTSNYVGIGFWSNDDLFRVYATGNIYMGTVTTGVWNGTAISDTYISSATNWNSAYTNRITSLTTTGTSGVATLISNVLNIPNYGSALSSYVPYTGGTANVDLNGYSLTAGAATLTSNLWLKNTGTYDFIIGNSTGLTTNVVRAYYTTADELRFYAKNTAGTAVVPKIMVGDGTTFTQLATVVGSTSLTTVGTITTGTWNGTSISTTYTDAKVTAVNAGTGVSVSSTTGSVTVSIGQSVATTATPTFGSTTINGNLVVTGVTYSAAGATVQGAGAYDWFYVGRGSSASALWLKDITGAGWALMGGSYSLAFKKDVSGTSWATALSLTATSSGDTSPNVSIANNLSIGGTVTSGTWNGSSISTTYTAAKVTAVNAGTGVSVDTTTGSVTVSIGQAVATTSTPTFARVSTPKIAIERNANTANGISWYNISTYTSWCDYMAAGGTTSTGPTGNITASTGTYVTSWARRFFVEDASTYGWIFEKGAVAGQPSVVAELRSSDGLFSTAGAIYSAGNLVKHFGNSTYATSFTNVSSVTVTHNLGSKDVLVMCYDSSDNMFWPSSIVTTSTSVVTITFTTSRTGRVVVVR